MIVFFFLFENLRSLEKRNTHVSCGMMTWTVEQFIVHRMRRGCHFNLLSIEKKKCTNRSIFKIVIKLQLISLQTIQPTDKSERVSSAHVHWSRACTFSSSTIVNYCLLFWFDFLRLKWNEDDEKKTYQTKTTTATKVNINIEMKKIVYQHV